MARNPDLDAALAAVDVATTGLGAGVTALQAALDALSTRVFALTTIISTRMSDAEVAAVKNSLDVETNKIDNAVVGLGAIADALNQIAVDPTDPVPEPVPEPIEELPSTPVV